MSFLHITAMTVLGGLQSQLVSAKKVVLVVSIPMTVLGGLQLWRMTTSPRSSGRFNTDDGIRRAAMMD